MFDFEKLIENKKHYSMLLFSAQTKYDAMFARLSIEALSTSLFPDKKNPDMKLCASNDTERKFAVEYIMSTDSELLILAAQLAELKREYAAAHEQLECSKLMMQYAAAQAGLQIVK